MPALRSRSSTPPPGKTLVPGAKSIPECRCSIKTATPSAVSRSNMTVAAGRGVIGASELSAVLMNAPCVRRGHGRAGRNTALRSFPTRWTGECLGQVVGGHHIGQQTGGDHFTLREDQTMAEALRDLLDVMSDQHQRRGVRG